MSPRPIGATFVSPRGSSPFLHIVLVQAVLSHDLPVGMFGISRGEKVAQTSLNQATPGSAYDSNPTPAGGLESG